MTAGAGVSGTGTTTFTGGTTNISAPLATAANVAGGTANFNGASYSLLR